MANPFSRFIKKAANNFYVTVVSPSNSKFSDIFGSPSLSASQLIANFETIPDLFKITNFIADKCSQIPIKVVKRNGKDSSNADLLRLIDSPNNYQSWGELVKTFFSYYEPLGNSYLYGIKPDGMRVISQIYCLPADKIQVVLLRDKSLPAWLNEVAGYQVTIGGVDYNLPPDMVLHERYVSLRYDDGSWVYGMSKYIPGDKINRELKAIHDAKTSIIEQRGALGFITNESEMPDPEQSKEVKEKLKASTGYGVLGDQDKVIVTTEKLRWQQMALGVQELQLIENAKYSFNSLCQMNGFDPVIFSTEGSTFANKKEAIKEMTLKVIKPKVDNFYSSLNTWIGAGFNGDMIVPDWSKVEEMQEDRKAMTELLTKQIGSMIITPKKAQEILYGEIDSENEPPDYYFRTTNLVPALQPEAQDPTQGPITPEMIAMLENQKETEENDPNTGEDGN